jgi:hypothetical protein
MSLFNYATLSGLVDQTIQVADDQENCCQLTIECVEETSPNNDRWQSFAVSYKADPDVKLVQGNYIVTHPDFGKETTFIIPIGPERYETLITCSREPE